MAAPIEIGADRGQTAMLRLAWIATLLALQVTILALAVAWNDRRASAARHISPDLMAGSAPKIPPLTAGNTVPPLRVAQDGHPVDLTASARTQGLLLVSSCQSCAAQLVDECDALWRKGVRIAVVSRSTDDDIRVAREVNQWRLPIYSDADAANEPETWRSIRRPWFCVVKAGRVKYGQSLSEPPHEALARVNMLCKDTREM